MASPYALLYADAHVQGLRLELSLQDRSAVPAQARVSAD